MKIKITFSQFEEIVDNSTAFVDNFGNLFYIHIDSDNNHLEIDNSFYDLHGLNFSVSLDLHGSLQVSISDYDSSKERIIKPLINLNRKKTIFDKFFPAPKY